MSTDTPKLSPVETIKEGSDYLKGTIDQEIAGSVNHFDKSNIQLLKFLENLKKRAAPASQHRFLHTRPILDKIRFSIDSFCS